MNGQSYITLDGQTKYSVSRATSFFQALTFLGYPEGTSGGFDKWLIRGRVVDIDGKPIDGAAIGIDDKGLITNSAGDFLLRTKHARRYRLDVRLNDFVNPIPFEVYVVPAEVQSSPAAKAAVIEVVLKAKSSPLQVTKKVGMLPD